jgi:uncharacterized membrane protein YqhA
MVKFGRGRVYRQLVGWTRFIVLIPVIALLLGAFLLSISAGLGLITIVIEVLNGSITEKALIVELITMADAFLLSTVLYIISLGLYELFIDDRIPLPKWLEIHDLDGLKEKLVGVIVVVLAVIFLGIAVQAKDPMNVLLWGGGVAAVIASLTYFLSQIKGKESPAEGPEDLMHALERGARLEAEAEAAEEA